MKQLLTNFLFSATFLFSVSSLAGHSSIEDIEYIHHIVDELQKPLDSYTNNGIKAAAVENMAKSITTFDSIAPTFSMPHNGKHIKTSTKSHS